MAQLLQLSVSITMLEALLAGLIGGLAALRAADPLLGALTEAHGGLIWFEARPSGGTDVRFTIPLERRLEEGLRAAAV